MASERLEIETYFGKCKCCFNYGYLKTMWDKHVVDEKSEIYGQMLIECFSIEWTIQNSEEDDQICEDCIWKLREAFTFKKQVLECQKELDNMQVDEELEIKSEPDNQSYDVEYLDEECLEEYNNNEKSDEENGEERESEDEKPSPDDESSSIAFKEENEDGIDENETPEEEDDEDSTLDSPTLPKRRPRQQRSNDDDSDSDTPKPKWAKKLPKQERWKTYRQYSDEAMRDAVQAVVSKTMNQKDASKRFKVPRKTLSAKVISFKNAESIEKQLVPRADSPIEQDSEDRILILKKHRENIHSVLAYSNATPIRGFWGVGYVCAFCPEQFPMPSTLKKHTRSHTDYPTLYIVPQVRTHATRLDVTGLKCRICDAKMNDLQSFMRHLKREHKKPMHFDIKNHIIPFKFETTELECVECEKKFTNFKLLSEHMANVHYRNYVCGECDRGFVNKANLVAHKYTHRTGMFNCDICGKQFDTLRRKTTHERIKHTLQTKYEKCGYCTLSFQNITQKNNHEMRVHKKQLTSFKCMDCDRSYAHQDSLRYHVKREHLIERPYKCTEEGCNKSFYLNRTLQAHIFNHDDGRPFSCRVCSKAYKSASSLKGHMYTHSDKKEFKCTKCYKSYVLEENFIQHLKNKHRS